ncbi:POLD2 [Symbiodinium natans]|uniref:POLD2 protein n=1 Tax=Symbiodinium natans TaxID=878477 RepID=A0A812SBR5_9DINO|nr:POLD2 [Symbiodinium natans]
MADHSKDLVALASGFRIGNARTRKAELLLLRDFLLGLLGTEEDIAMSQRVGRLVIAGGVHAADAELPSCLGGRPKRPRLPVSEKARRSFAAAAADEADLFLGPLACHLRLCIMSGEGDCGVSTRLPQLAPPFAIFPRCRRTGNLELWANPHCHVEGDLQVVGHAGQPLQLALRNASEPATALDTLVACWHRRHLAPRWPEFLVDKERLQAFRESCGSGLSDPFAIPAAPQACGRAVLFAGNCGEATWERVSGPGVEGANEEAAVICIPDFTEEPSLLLLNVQDLTIKPVRFRVA